MNKCLKIKMEKIIKLKKKYLIFILGFIALVVRLIYWSHTGIKLGGDSGEYLKWAQNFAVGNYSAFKDYPFHQVYAIFLSPIYAVSIDKSFYIKYSHVVVSTLIVLLLFFIGKELVSKSYGGLVALFACVYPSLLFWMSYVLTETLYIFLLLLFVLLFVKIFDKIHIIGFVGCLGVGTILFFARPTSIIVFIVSILFLAYKILNKKFGWKRFRSLFTISFMVTIVALCLYVVISKNGKIKKLVSHNPTIVQSLWLSVNLETNDMIETREVLRDREEELRESLGAGYTQDAVMEVKMRDALGFISAHPFLYLAKAAKRFSAFWFPWLYASTWSSVHRIVDIFLSLFLTIGAILAFGNEEMRNTKAYYIMFLALGFGLLSAFSQIDTDARYRLPAEIMLLLLAPYGWISVSKKLLWKRIVKV